MYPVAQKFRLPYLYFNWACLSKIIIALLPLRYPTNADMLVFGSILKKQADVIRHHVLFCDFYAFQFAQISYDLPNVFS